MNERKVYHETLASMVIYRRFLADPKNNDKKKEEEEEEAENKEYLTRHTGRSNENGPRQLKILKISHRRIYWSKKIGIYEERKTTTDDENTNKYRYVI